MKKFIKKILPENIKQEIKDELGVPSLSALLKHLSKVGFTPKIVFDIGAYEGYWALDIVKAFPLSSVHMFEAQKAKESYLRKLCDANSNCAYTIALLGSEDGKMVDFEENETASHVNVSRYNEQQNGRLTETLDGIIDKLAIPFPDFLKLDVQGYELEVLKGGKTALANSEFCLLEVSLIDLGGGSPLLIDVVNFMDTHGFCAYDISQFIRRPLDNALWQIDMLFIKKNSAFIAKKKWK